MRRAFRLFFTRSFASRRRWRLLVVFGALCVMAWWRWDYWRLHRFDSVILAASRRYQLDPALVKAVVWRESRFNPRARGRAGELGLMQVRAVAAQEWAAAEKVEPFDHQSCLNPATNTLAGTWYLKKVLTRYRATDNPLAYALADYNAGRGNVLKWQTGQGATNSLLFMSQIEFPSTRDYVRSVLRWLRDHPSM